MTTLTDPALHEVLDQWPAWQLLVEYVMPPGNDARTVNPTEVAAALSEMGSGRRMRILFLLVGYQHTDTLREASVLLGELRHMAVAGTRPRYGAEAGMTLDEFEGLR